MSIDRAKGGDKMIRCDFWHDPRYRSIDLPPDCCMRLGGPWTCPHGGQGKEVCDLYEPYQEITWKEVKRFLTRALR